MYACLSSWLADWAAGWPLVYMSAYLSDCLPIRMHSFKRVFRLPYTQASNTPLRAETAQQMALHDFTRGVLEAREKGLSEVKDWDELMMSYCPPSMRA
jgi:hypothetical protein